MRRVLDGVICMLGSTMSMSSGVCLGERAVSTKVKVAVAVIVVLAASKGWMKWGGHSSDRADEVTVTNRTVACAAVVSSTQEEAHAAALRLAVPLLVRRRLHLL